MPIAVHCAECESTIQVADVHAGKRTKCKGCGGMLVIPPLAESEPARPARSTAEDGGTRLRRARAGESRTGARRGGRGRAAPTALPPMAIAAGLGVAFAGAAIWALLVTKTGREFGWLSWGIGAAIGTSMLKLGARGPGAALIALLVTAAGLLGGRFASLTLLRDRIAHQILEGELEQELESRARVAEQIAALDRPISDATLEQLNYEHYLVELEGPNPTAAEFDAIREALDDFEAFAEPQAREELMQSAKAEMRATLPMSSLFRYSLTPMGVIFATLGLITALTMVLRAR